MNIVFILTGGAIGTLLRYALSGLVYRTWVSAFPWGTLFVNLTGSFVIGLLWGLFESDTLSPIARNFLFIGILGGFTTFSTFTLESMNLVRSGETGLAISNILANNMGGIFCVVAGFFLSRYVMTTVK